MFMEDLQNFRGGPKESSSSIGAGGVEMGVWSLYLGRRNI